MSRTINQVLIVGNLGADPELTTVGDSAVANFSIATNQRWRDKAGKDCERTDWHKCVAWGKPGEIIAQYVRKGEQLTVIGELRYRKYTDRNGVEREVAEVFVRDFTFAGSRSETPAAAAPSRASATVGASADVDPFGDLPF